MVDPRPPLPTDTRYDVYSVSRLAREVKQLLESAFPLVRVEGELSNVARPRSGHLYFTLKDEHAQIRCAMFRNRNALLRFQPKEGDRVLARVKIGLYAPRGDFQLIVEHMEEAGEGALRRTFDVLKARLEAEGLFAAERKRDLPALPRRVGVVTSATGAALRDVLHVLQRRFPALAVLVFPVRVQGNDAAADIASAIRRASERKEVDVLMITRGGGSLEDLWAFNEEVVARAIYDSTIPVVSAVGHETDVTIADFVADRRAPTPSAGAEMVSPDGAALLTHVDRMRRSLTDRITRHLRDLAHRQQTLAQRLHAQHPGRRLQERAQRLDELEARLLRAQRVRTAERRTRLDHAARRLWQLDPRRRLADRRSRITELRERLRVAMTGRLGAQHTALAATTRALDTVSPLATVARGYAIVTHESSGAIVRQHGDVAAGERIRARIVDGELVCRVEEIEPHRAPPPGNTDP